MVKNNKVRIVRIIGKILSILAGAVLLSSIIAMATMHYLRPLTLYNSTGVFVISFIIVIIGGIMSKW